jgi:hypothetical protein
MTRTMSETVYISTPCFENPFQGEINLHGKNKNPLLIGGR